MSSYLCTSCWRIVPLEKARYACPVCSSDPDLPAFATPDGEVQQPTYGQSKSQRFWRRLLTDGGGDPRCPIHRDTGVALYCECRARLHSRARIDAGEPTGLGFAGPASSGKTLLTLSAVARMEGLDLGGRKLTLFGIGDTAHRFGKLVQKLREGQKPDRTALEGMDSADGSPRNFCWELIEANGSETPRRMGLLAVYDLAGETWNANADEEFDPRRQPRRLETFLRYLQRLKSLVFLVDGAAVALDLTRDLKDKDQARDAWVPKDLVIADAGSESSLFALIHSRLGDRTHQIDLALTLSKTDLLWDLPGYEDLRPGRYETLAAERRYELLLAILTKAGRAGLLQAARQYFRRVDLFGVSSIGYRPTAETVTAANWLTEPPRPVGVTAPIQWLLSPDADTTTPHS